MTCFFHGNADDFPNMTQPRKQGSYHADYHLIHSVDSGHSDSTTLTITMAPKDKRAILKEKIVVEQVIKN